MLPRGQQDHATTRALVAAIQPIETLLERYGAIKSAAFGSPAAADIDLANGKVVWSLSGTAWGASADHAMTWWELIKARVQPERSHYTLARAILEGAATVRWLLDPPVAVDRRARAMQLQLDDYNERANYEADPLAHRDQLGAMGKTGAQRREGLRREMKRLDVRLDKPPGLTGRCSALGLAWLYRLLSAYAHGQQWSLTKVDMAVAATVPGMPGVYSTAITARDDISILAAQQVMVAFDGALSALEAYMR